MITADTLDPHFIGVENIDTFIIRQDQLFSKVAPFLSNHKRKCPANKGRACTCGLEEARQAFHKLAGQSWEEYSKGEHA